MTKNIKVVILAGGLGTRLPEYTKKIPKPMVKINGIPIIIYIMTRLNNMTHQCIIRICSLMLKNVHFPITFITGIKSLVLHECVPKVVGPDFIASK